MFKETLAHYLIVVKKTTKIMGKRNERSHYKIVNGKFIEKKSFDSEHEALKMARFLIIESCLKYNGDVA